METKVTRATFDEVMVPCFSPMQMIPVNGKGSKVWDQNGKEYIDFAGGIAVSALGHCHPIMIKALEDQAHKVWHVSNVMTNEPALKLAKKLTELTFADKVFFCNSGGEANEAAFKLARRYALDTFGDEKDEIIAFDKAFHGRTLFTVSVGGKKVYADGFGPKPMGITHLPYNDIDTLKAHISEKTCAVVLEPIQGEGGIISPTSEFIQGVRALCDQYHAVLIFDEVQTGNGRTGDFYAYQGLGVTPDILTTAKSIGGGFPIASMLTTEKFACHFKPGTHGTTFGGNPLACAVALAVVNQISKPEVLEGVKIRGQKIVQGLKAINEKYHLFKAYRGKGLLIGAVLTEDWVEKRGELFNLAGDYGVLILTAGSDVIRIAPSYVISDTEISEGLKRFEQAIAFIANKSLS